MSLKKHCNFNPFLLCLKTPSKENPQLSNLAKEMEIESVVLNCKGKFGFNAVKEIIKYIVKHKIDIVHTHGYKADLYGLIAAKLSKKPNISTLHGWTSENGKIVFYEYLNKLLLRFNSHTVAVSPLIYEEAKKRGVKQKRISLILNGIDTDRFCPDRTDIGLNKDLIFVDKTVIGSVGRLSPEKGHIFLIKAFAILKEKICDSILVLSGDGILLDELKDIAKKNGVENDVVFTGVVDDIENIYRAIDLFVLPSLTEGIPLVLLEAMSMKLPVIATNVGGVPHVIDRHCGKLVSPGSIQDLSDSIFVLANDMKKRQQMGEKGRKRVIDNFSSALSNDNYMKLYNNISIISRL